MSSRNGWSWMRGDGELISSSPSKSSVASDSDASLVDLQEDYELLLLKDEDTPASPVRERGKVVSEASNEKQQQPAKVEPTPPAPTTTTADNCRKSKNQGIADFRELVEQKLKKELPPAKTKVVAEQRQAFFSKFFGKMFGASSTTEKNKYKVNKEVDVTPVLEKLVQANEQKNSEGVVAKGKKKMGEKAEELNDIKDELIAFIRGNADKLIAQLKEATKQADAQTKEKVAIICAQIKDVSNRAIAWIKGHFLVLRGKVIDGFLLYFNFMDKLAAQCYDLVQSSSTSVLLSCGGSKCAKRCRMVVEGTVDKLKTARVNMLGGAGSVAEAAVEEKRGDSSSETEEEKNYVKLEKEEEDSCMKGAEAAENVGGRGDVGAASVRKAAKDLKKRARRACAQRVKASKKSARAFRRCLLRAKHKTFGNLTKMRIALTRTVFRHSGILDDEDRRVCQIHEIQDDDFLNGNNDDSADLQDLRKTIRESLKKTSTKTTAFMNSLRAAKTSFADGATKVLDHELQTSEGGSTNSSTRTYSSRGVATLLARKFSDFFAGCSGGVTSGGNTTTAFQHRLLGTMSLGSCCLVQKNKGPFHAVAFLVLLLALQSRLLLLSVVVDAPDDYDNYGYFGLMGGRQGSSSSMYDPHTGVCPLKKRNLLSLLMNGKDEVTTSAIGGKASWFAPSDLSAFRAALFGVQQCPVEKLWAHSRLEPACYWSTANSYKAARLATDEDDEKAFTTSAETNHNDNKVSEKPHARLQAKKRGDKFMLKPRSSSNSNSSAASSVMYGPAGFAADFANKSVFSIMRDYVKSKLGFSSNSFAYRNATSTNVQKLSEEAVQEAKGRVLNNYRRGASHFYRGSMRRGYVGGPKVRGGSSFQKTPYARRSRFNAASHNLSSQNNKMQILLDQEMLNLKLAEEEKAQSEQAVPAVLFLQMEKPLYGPANDMHNSRIQLAKSLVLYQNPSLSVRDFSDEHGRGTCGYANSDVAKRFRKAEALRVRARKMKAAEEKKQNQKALRAPRRQMSRRSGPSNKVVDVFCSAQGFCGYAEQLNDNGISGSFSPRPQPSAASEHSYYPLINVPIPTPVPFPAPTVQQHVRDYSLRRPASVSRRSTFTTSTTTAAVMFPKLSGPSHGTYLPAPFSVEYRQQLQAARDSRAVGVYFSGKPVSSSKRGKKSTSQVGQKKQKLVSSTLTEVESDRANFTSLLRNYSLSPKTSTSLVPNMSLSVAPKHLFRNATDMLISRRTSTTPAPTTKLTLTTAGPGLSPTFFMPTNNYPMPLMRMQSDSSNPSSRKRYRRLIFPSSPQLGRGAGNNYESENGGQCPSYEGPLYLDSQMPGSENVPVRNITAAREAYMKVIGLE